MNHCPHCQDTGITETLGAQYIQSVAEYCACDAGRRRRLWAENDPESVDRVMAARKKFLTLKTLDQVEGEKRSRWSRFGVVKAPD
jgi:hypothetical protein